jgi:cytochrome c-type biogenesis protein CcmH/NrfF
MKVFYSFLFIIITSQHSFAISSESYLPEYQEKRARELFLQIKCPICDGQVIESSNTEIAFELRKLVRSKIIEGRTNKEIKFYFVEKYGDDILNSTPFNLKTALLWILPLIFVIIGILIIKNLSRKS